MTPLSSTTSDIVETISIRNVIDNKLIHTLYQPIVRLDNGKVIGYEALSRGPQNTSLTSPLALLAEAEKTHCLWELELLFRKLAIERCRGLQPDQCLFLNVDPRIIHDATFQKGFTREYLREQLLAPGCIVFEITERAAITNLSAYEAALNNYKNQGYQIAIDDAGSGYSGMQTIALSRPGYVKIDMDIVRNVQSDPLRQAIVKSFVLLGQTADIRIIAEGIETREELKTLIQLGVYAGQGYYLMRPATGIQPIPLAKEQEISTMNYIKANQTGYSSHYHYIGNLAMETPSLSPETPCGQLEGLFRRKETEAFCLADQGYILGLITRNDLFRAMSSQHGHAVYTRRPSSLIMNTNPLTVDFYTSVTSVADLAMKRPPEKMYDPVVITKGYRYFGMVAVKDLLRYSVEYERDFARELNPLTQLPGNKIISRVLNDLLVYSTHSAVLYFDLDHFKAYNDVYGFENGDHVIILAARIIQDVIKRRDALNSFVGHIGGDDFVAVIENAVPETIHGVCRQIIHAFDQEILSHYSEEDRKNGFISAEDRNGITTQYRIVSMSVAALYGELTKVPSVDILGGFMATIKKDVKRISGSAYSMIPVCSFNKPHGADDDIPDFFQAV